MRGRWGRRGRRDRSNERTGNECVDLSGGIGGCGVDRSQRAQEVQVLIRKVLKRMRRVLASCNAKLPGHSWVTEV